MSDEKNSGGPKDKDFDFEMENIDLVEFHGLNEQKGKLNTEGAQTQAYDSNASEDNSENSDREFEMVEEPEQSKSDANGSGMKKFIILALVVGVLLIGALGWVGVQIFGSVPGAPQDSGQTFNEQAQQIPPASQGEDAWGNSGAASNGAGASFSRGDELAFGDMQQGHSAANEVPVVGSMPEGLDQWGEPITGQSSTFDDGEYQSPGQMDEFNGGNRDIAAQGGYEDSNTQPNQPFNDDIVLSPPSLTDEEKMYDAVLAQAEKMDVPPDAIVINQEVVARSVEARRMENLESQIVETRESISSVLNVVSSIQGTLADYSKAVEATTEKQSALSAQIDELSKTVAGVSAAQSAVVADMKKIEAQATNAQRVASTASEQVASVQASGIAAARSNLEAEQKKRAEAQRAQQARRDADARERDRVATQQAQEKARAAEQERARADVAQRARAVTPVQAVATQAQAAPRTVATNDASTGSACQAGGTVSSVWRVQGVNGQLAYLVRPQDGTGVIVSEGVPVPGFGSVVSLDPVNRSVCTTNGVIQR